MFTTPHLDLPILTGAQGTVHLPGSKSISNRVLLLAALSQGTTSVHDLLASDDTRVMLDALRAIGCGVDESSTVVRITGLGGRPPISPAQLFMGNAGTAMRPLTAALSLLGGEFELSGVARMHERPIGDLVDALRQLGCRIDYLGNDGYPPLRIDHHLGVPALHLNEPIRVRGDVSSQFLTALLMALPLAATHQDIVIEVVGELISKPYIAITLQLLARFGIDVAHDNWQRFTIPAASRYRSPGDIHVEADASSASYFIALGAIAPGDGIRIQGVGLDSIQGDIRFVDAAAAMGARITGGPNWLHVRRGEPGDGWPLRGIDLDCNHIPDAAMTLAVVENSVKSSATLQDLWPDDNNRKSIFDMVFDPKRLLVASLQRWVDWSQDIWGQAHPKERAVLTSLLPPPETLGVMQTWREHMSAMTAPAQDKLHADSYTQSLADALHAPETHP